MTSDKLKFIHNIAAAVLLVGLLMGCYAAGVGDISGSTLMIGWGIGVALFLGSYTYFSLTGKIQL